MALRDKVVIRLDGSVPVKDRLIEVTATSPGGVVDFEPYGDTHFEVTEKTRKGKEKRAVVVSREHVVSLEVILAK